MENSNSKLKVVGTLILGALAGVAIGVLFAPDKGSKTRQKIKEGANDLADDMKQKMRRKAREMRNKADELEEMATDKVNEVASNFKHKTETHKN